MDAPSGCPLYSRSICGGAATIRARDLTRVLSSEGSRKGAQREIEIAMRERSRLFNTDFTQRRPKAFWRKTTEQREKIIL